MDNEQEFVSIYQNAFSPVSDDVMKLNDVLYSISAGVWEFEVNRIRSETNKKRIDELKKSLPCVTFSGTFNQTRKISNIESYTGIIVADIDKFEGRNQKQEVRDKLTGDKYILSFFDSPSKGLKVLFKTNSTIEDHSTIGFGAISIYMEKAYGVKLDPSGKDISRLCFVSFDPNMYWNQEAKTLNVYHPKLQVEKKDNNEGYTYKPPTDPSYVVTNEDVAFNIARKMVEKQGFRYRKGERNEYLYRVSCVLYRAGMSTDNIRRTIHRHHSISNQMDAELEASLKGIDKNNKSDFGTRPLWQKQNEKKISLFSLE